MRTGFKKIIGISTLAFAIPSGAIFAAYVNHLPETAVSEKGFQGLIDYINQASGWLFGILLALAVVFLIYAAFLYLTSGGDEEKTKAAKNYIIYAVVALAVGFLATGIVILVGSFFDQPQNPSPECIQNTDCPTDQFCSEGTCIFPSA